jgi:hypothetical protein
MIILTDGNQILGITCDNASNNDVMVDELEDLLPGFSRVNHTRCFLHVNNLVARTLVRQFDIPRAKPGIATDDDDPDRELRELAGDIDLEERQTREALLEESADGELDPDDDNEGWAGEMAALSQAEREGLQDSLRPVQMILVKVSLEHNEYNNTLLTSIDRSGKWHLKPSIRQHFSSQHGRNASKI